MKRKSKKIQKNTKKLLFFAIIIVIIAIIFSIFVKKNSKSKNDNIITPIESHEISDEEVEQLNSKDRANVIVYWSMADDKSLEILKLFNSFSQKYTDTINFIAVNTTDNSTKAAVYLNNNQISMHSASSSNLNIEEINEKELEEFPYYAFVKKDGELLDFTNKELTEDSLEAYLDILAENY